MTSLVHKNILLKVAIVETNAFTGERTFMPVITPKEDSFVYSEFEKAIGSNSLYKIGNYKIGESRYDVGDNRTSLVVGETFMVWSSMIQSRRTSKVVEIYTPNLFLTMNTLYFIKDEPFQIQMARNNKLDQIL